MAHQMHAYHMVDPSPWPLTGAAAALLMTSGLAMWFHHNSMLLMTLGLLIMLLTMFQWWRDVIREGTFQGHHTPPSTKKPTMWHNPIYHIKSILLHRIFLSFLPFKPSPYPKTKKMLTTYKDYTTKSIRGPPIKYSSTISLKSNNHLSSPQPNKNKPKPTIQALTITILLGLYFTALQAMEYYEAPFTIADGVYGSTFFVATGFHGLHVIIGSTFLIVCLLRQIKFHFTSTHHFGFEAAAWYWHFVDVVWLVPLRINLLMKL
uniref:Cytochrome c oxidase subunit 3 n=1 Tax=Lepidochelys olivacea TaxID=27788 RepID=B6GV41_LEPOA|nr:cytochrome c oxidase subunit III [Lepidochelys olivacea]CAJ90459.1 cytochrome c oxidase subunit III [Lepidochelys olivacea]